MAPCLSKFPSVCLEAIFFHVPLYDLFYSVGLVCTSWHKSRRTELMRRRRLVLIQSNDQEDLNNHRVSNCFYDTELIEHVRREDGSPWYTLETLEQFKFNLLLIPEGLQTILFAASFTNFTNISRLYLNLTRTTLDLTQITRLIEHFSQHLVELKLDLDFNLDYDVGEYEWDEDEDRHVLTLNLTNVIECLNRLQSVRHLNLSLMLSNSDSRIDTIRALPLSCLTRLATFAINIYGYEPEDDWRFASIKQYGQNLTSIEIGDPVKIRAMLQFDAQLAAKFKVLSVEFRERFDGLMIDRLQIHEDIRLFCSRFSSLTKLMLQPCFSSIPMTKLARFLSLLTQLVHLVLYFYHIPLVEQPEEVEEGEMEVEEHAQEELAQQEIAQVPSVRLLETSFSIKSHLDTERLFIPEIFPNLQVLQLEQDIFECVDCEINPDDYEADYGEGGFDRVDETNLELGRRIAECIRLTRLPFRRCANLHTVALDVSGKQTLINRDDL